MIKKFINKDSIFYKPYLFFRIFWLEKFFLKKKSYSQCGEDIFIIEFFKDKINKGTYLDIGAFQGEFSRSLIISGYKKKIAIESLKKNYEWKP